MNETVTIAAGYAEAVKPELEWHVADGRRWAVRVRVEHHSVLGETMQEFVCGEYPTRSEAETHARLVFAHGTVTDARDDRSVVYPVSSVQEVVVEPLI